MSDRTVVSVIDEGLGNSAYLVDLGDGRALVVDASLDLRAVRSAVDRRGLRVAFAADTHLHADFVSGSTVTGRSGCSPAGHCSSVRPHERTSSTPRVPKSWPAPSTTRCTGSPTSPTRSLSGRPTAWGRSAPPGAVAATALTTGYLAATYGLRPEPFYVGLAYAALGLGLSTLAVHETRGHARLEASIHTTRSDGKHDHLHGDLDDRAVFVQTSLREPALSAASQAGMVNNLNDGLAWGLFPVLFAAAGMSVTRIGVLAALYPAVWGIGQLVTGAWSDRVGRKPLIVAGMLTQAGGLAMVAAGDSFGVWAFAAVLLGAGTALVYPTLLAAVGDVAHPAWQARAVGVYRMWRDGGFAVGALLAGVLADAFGVRAAVWAVAGLTAASGIVVAVRMYETLHRQPSPAPGPQGGARERPTGLGDDD